MEARIPIQALQDSHSWNLTEGEGRGIRNNGLRPGIRRHRSENVAREHVLPQDRDHLAIQTIKSQTQIRHSDFQEHPRGAVQREHATAPSSRSSPASHFGSVAWDISMRTPPSNSMSTVASIIGKPCPSSTARGTSTHDSACSPLAARSRRFQYVKVESADPCRAQKSLWERPLRSCRSSHPRRSSALRRQIFRLGLLVLRAELALLWCFMQQPITARTASPPACRR